VREYDKIFIGNEWVEPDGRGVIKVISPHTEDVIGQVPDASPADMDRAVASRPGRFDDGQGVWPQMDPSEAADAISRCRRRCRPATRRSPTRISARRHTKQWSLLGQVFSSDDGPRHPTPTSPVLPVGGPPPGRSAHPLIVRRPRGRGGGIIPWNVPLFHRGAQARPGDGGGLPDRAQARARDALDAYLLAEAVLEADLPPGAVNIVVAGRETGEHWCATRRRQGELHRQHRGGAHIGGICGGQLKRSPWSWAASRRRSCSMTCRSTTRCSTSC